MPVTYTNHKGLTYHLCQVATKTGKPRYVFAREPKGDPLEEIPAGWHIRESVNGVVSLARDRPAQILPGELAAVEAAVARHPKSHSYRVAVRRNRIEVYERVGPDAGDLLASLAEVGLETTTRLAGRLRVDMDRRAQFAPVLRFVLTDAAERTFRVERMCYRSSVDGWLDVHQYGPADRLARQWVPRLGTDAFFGVF
jgi:hypothetical protein